MKYTTNEISKTLGVSLRTAQRYLESFKEQILNNNFLEEDIFNVLIERYKKDSQTTTERQENELDGITEYFTNEEYEEFQKRLTEYPMLKQMLKASEEYISSLRNDVEYHRGIYQKHLDIHEKLIDSIKERNFIEAKEKRLDR